MLIRSPAGPLHPGTEEARSFAPERSRVAAATGEPPWDPLP